MKKTTRYLFVLFLFILISCDIKKSDTKNNGNSSININNVCRIYNIIDLNNKIKNKNDSIPYKCFNDVYNLKSIIDKTNINFALNNSYNLVQEDKIGLRKINENHYSSWFHCISTRKRFDTAYYFVAFSIATNRNIKYLRIVDEYNKKELGVFLADSLVEKELFGEIEQHN